MGAPLKKILNFESSAICELKKWGLLSSAELNELISWSGIKDGKVRLRFRGEQYVSQALRNPIVRGCPICLREDAELHGGNPIEAMVMRGDWQLREAVLCKRHAHPLVPLWNVAQIIDRFDVGARLSELVPSIMRGDLDRAHFNISAYDEWLDARLSGVKDEQCLGNVSTYVATTFSRLLGAELLNLSPAETKADLNKRHEALTRGFQIISQGEEKTRAAFDLLAARATRALDQPNKAFGQVYVKLAREYKDDESFDAFREILRECILDTWPIGQGQLILGVTQPKRKLHSLVTAATETGVGTRVLELFLTEAGALTKNDERPDSRKTFDAQRHAELLSEIPKLVGPIAMREAMGATRAELAALERDRVLIPRTKISKIKFPWRLSDGIDLVKELQAAAHGEVERDAGWESIQTASKRTIIPVGDFISAIRRDCIEVKLMKGLIGYHAIYVSSQAVDEFKRARYPAVDPDIAGVMSASAFARSVGLRRAGNFIAFVEAGHSPAINILHPRTKRRQFRMSKKDIEDFHHKFMTTTTIATEFGLHRNTVLNVLEARQMMPFSPDGIDYGPIWLRAEIEPVFEV